MKQLSLTFLFIAALILPAACATTAGPGPEWVTVSQFVDAPYLADDDVVTVRGIVIDDLNDRTFAMGTADDVILVVAPADDAILTTRGDAGDTVMVTGTVETFRRDDPAMPFIDEEITDEFLNEPGIIASNVQVVAVD